MLSLSSQLSLTELQLNGAASPCLNMIAQYECPTRQTQICIHSCNATVFTVWVQVNVSKVAPYGGVDLNRAMSTIYNQTRAFLIHNYDLTEDMVGTVNALCLCNVTVTMVAPLVQYSSGMLVALLHNLWRP